MVQFLTLRSTYIPMKKEDPSINRRYQAPTSFARRFLIDDSRRFFFSIMIISVCFLLLISKGQFTANALCLPSHKHIISRSEVSHSYSYNKPHSQTRKILQKRPKGIVTLCSLKEPETTLIAIQRRGNQTESDEPQHLLNSPTYTNGYNLSPKNGKKLEETNGKVVPQLLKSKSSNLKFESMKKQTGNLNGENLVNNVDDVTNFGSNLTQEFDEFSISPDLSEEEGKRNKNQSQLKLKNRRWKPFLNYTSELKSSYKNLWKKRYARTIDEGIRFEKISVNDPALAEKQKSSQIPFLSKILNNAHKVQRKKRYAARTITGLLVALAEESSGVQVEVDARQDTPISGKQIDSITINFSR